VKILTRVLAFVLLANLVTCVQFHIDRNTSTTADSQSALYVEDDAWKAIIDQRIREELTGQRPPSDAPTWKEYWVAWYQVIRQSAGLPWTPSQFKTKEDMIQYVKQRRKSRGLAAYD
jgi:hypothetical protein